MAERQGPDAAVPDPNQADGATQMAVTHRLSLDVPAQWLERQFAAALARCVMPECVVLNSQIDRSFGAADPPSGTLVVRLTHAAVAPFRTAASAPLDNRPESAGTVRSQSTQAEDLGQVIADGARRLQQLRDFRTRLEGLATRPDIQVADLIRVAQTLSQTQTQLEQSEGQQRGLRQRVDTETMTVRYEGATAEAGLWSPVLSAWSRGGYVLISAIADALGFMFYVVPWVAVLGVLGLAGIWLVGLGRRCR